MTAETNIDPREIAKFDAIAARWWDPNGEFKPLHEINPLRLAYIQGRVALSGARVLDVGCGGGLLSEAMAAGGAQVTGIDLSEKALSVARMHLLESGLSVDYQYCAAETFAQQHPAAFDVVSCMELLEHVPRPDALVGACSALLRPGGHLFLSTLNRTAKAYLYAIIGAEYLLKLLTKGTHDYAKFIRPAELGHWLRGAGLELVEIRGITYQPLTRRYTLSRDIDVNYIVHAVKSD